MVDCPNCSHQFEADFGMVSCPSCQQIVIVGIDGQAQVSEPDPELESEPETHEPALAETVMAVASETDSVIESTVNGSDLAQSLVNESLSELNQEIPFENSAQEQSFANYQMPLQEEIDSSSPLDEGEISYEDPAEHHQADDDTSEELVEEVLYEASNEGDGDEDVSDDIDEDAGEMAEEGVDAPVISSDLEAEEEAWLHESSDDGEREEVADSSVGFSDVEEYGNSEASMAREGPYCYDLRISNIDSALVRKELEDILEDRKFAWNANKVIGNLENGVLVIEKLNPIKASIIVNRIKGTSLRVQWKQYALIQMETE